MLTKFLITAFSSFTVLKADSIYREFAALPIAKGTHQICLDECFPLGSVLEAVYAFNNDTLNDIFKIHGCYCPRLFGNPEFLTYITQGCEPADELDFLCKDWLRKRRCHTFTNGHCEAENIRTISYRMVDVDEDLTCEPIDTFTSIGCSDTICNLDLNMANKIRDYVANNTVDHHSCAAQEEGVCGSHGGSGVDTCCVSTLVAFRSDSDYVCPDE